MKQRKIVFYLCPGIRTEDRELNLLSGQFDQFIQRTYGKNKDLDVVVRKFQYGWVSTIANIFPVVRRVISRMLTKDIRTFNALGYEVILVTYSFSTFISAKVLFNRDNSDLNILYWVMFGGVINTRTDFTKLQANVRNIINFSSNEDEVAKYAPWFFAYGHSGAYGFRIENGLKRANNYKDGEELAWKNPWTDKPWVTNVYRNDVEHSGDDGWFGSLKHIKKMVSMLKDIE